MLQTMVNRVLLSTYAVNCRLQERNAMLQAMVDSPEEAEGWDAPQAERPAGAGGSMTSSTLHRILQVGYTNQFLTLQQTCHIIVSCHVPAVT